MPEPGRLERTFNSPGSHSPRGFESHLNLKCNYNQGETVNLEREYEHIVRNAGYGSAETIAGRAIGQGLAFLGLSIVESAKIIAEAIAKKGLPQTKRPPVLEDRLIDRE